MGDFENASDSDCPAFLKLASCFHFHSRVVRRVVVAAVTAGSETRSPRCARARRSSEICISRCVGPAVMMVHYPILSDFYLTERSNHSAACVAI